MIGAREPKRREVVVLEAALYIGHYRRRFIISSLLAQLSSKTGCRSEFIG